MAGVVGALIALPQGVAFAAIAGMPIQYGIYTGMVPAVMAALFGSSWHLVSGPTTAASIVMLSMIGVFAEPGGADYVSLVLTLTFMVGITQLGLGLAGMGALVNFISPSVVVGFTAGAALFIILSQVGHFFGLVLPHSIHSYETAHAMLLHLPDIDPAVTTVGILTVVSGLLCKRFLPWIPYMIPAMLVGGLVALVLKHWFGVGASQIPMAGTLPSSLPPLSMPSFSLDTIRQLAPAALAMTLFALTEAVSIGRSLAARSGQHLDGNQEFIGQGLSNIVGSFFSAYVATGSFNRSAANYAAGAKTPMAAIFAGLFLVAVVMLAAPLGAYLPKAAMAGVLFLVAVSLVDMDHIRRIIRISRSETAVLAVTFVCTLAFGLEFAILAGVILSLVVYLARTSRPPVISRVPDPNNQRRILVTNADLPECPQFKIVHIEGSLFFGAVHHVHESLRSIERDNPEQRHLAITAAGMNFIDVAGTEMLAEEAKALRERGGTLYFIRAKSGLMTPLRRSGYLKLIGEENFFSSKQEAIRTIVSRLDPNRCAGCTQRIFLECASLPHPHELQS
uniref:Sulfate permease, SulP family n=1 Tax=Candidatus Kentrum sp. TUN TaxID=2126343 RepID=A0A451ADL5_9GAMM|nr:MAG: sulfate permease, SulP family [Candidatus Kentron sp. TUN]VFK64118.1 MAG: sulfate permease, SulP family [Candidatus Kentron sp. TUN]VFK70059.1 MAG: sulfate permease, SulP family [Candidatus Kentron sp. TUN]